MIRGAAKIIRTGLEVGSTPFWEWPLHCQGWTDKSFQEIADMLPASIRVDGCTVGVRHSHGPHVGELAFKPWRIRSVNESALQRFRGLRCQHSVRHPPLLGGTPAATAYYPKPFAKRYVKGLHASKNTSQTILNDIKLALQLGPAP